MQLDLHGHPLHSRAVTVSLAQADAGLLDASAVLLDLRKRGFVPVGGDLGTPGIVHHMLLDAVVDPALPAVRSITARQPSVAFEPSALTAGESCRDPVDRVAQLAGAPLDLEFPRRLSAALGGALGCSHILTLAQQLGSASAWALASAAPRLVGPARRPGERLFRRDIAVDGHRLAGGDLEFAVQLTDLYFAPAPPLARPMDRFAAVHELRVWAHVAIDGVVLRELRAAERRRTRAELAAEAWTDRSARAGAAAGLSLFRGVSAALLERLGDAPADRPLLDALLMIAPTFIQVCAALSEQWPAAADRTASLVGMGGIPDSCYMWRRGGALDRARTPDDPAPLL
jgi:hypothetical protein